MSGFTPDAGNGSKLFTLQQLLSIRQAARRAGKAVVHCHGCFDIVHPGHIRHLRQARALGDILLVTITGDVEMKKGKGRPLIPEELRAENLAALDCVDWVYIEPRSTAVELLGELKPDIYVKGREYESSNDPRFRAERDAVEAAGGKVVFSSGDVVFSSTALIHALEASVDPSHARLSSLLGRADCSPSALADPIARMRGKRVLVVGETILDTYVLCDRPEVAGESPIMTLRPVELRHYDGGAAIIARHAAAMGARPVLLTPLPRGEHADALVKRLGAEGVELVPIHVEQKIPEKQRFLVGAQKVMKLDLMEPIVIDAAAGERIPGQAAEIARGFDAAILADFGLGLFGPRLAPRLCRALRPIVGTLAGDVSGRRPTLLAMRDMDLVCPTERELREAFNLLDGSLPFLVWKLMHETGARSAAVTLGPEGLVAFERLPDATDDPEAWRTRLRGEPVPALSAFAVDPLGCGDALLTASALALSAGAGLVPAMLLGSVAASIHAQRVGNVPVSATDLRQGLNRLASAHLAYAAAEVIDSRTVRPRVEPAFSLRAS